MQAQPLRCPSCGTVVGTGGGRCPTCGYLLPDEPLRQPATPSLRPRPPPQPAVRSRASLVLLLLAMLLLGAIVVVALLRFTTKPTAIVVASVVPSAAPSSSAPAQAATHEVDKVMTDASARAKAWNAEFSWTIMLSRCEVKLQ